MADELVASVSWSAGKRKFFAVKACTENDGDALISLLNAFLSAKGKKGSKTSVATRKTYETGLLRWMLFCWPLEQDSPNVKLLRATADDIEAFRTARQQAGNAPSTVSAYLNAVRTLYRALLWAGAIEVSPAVEVASPSDPRAPWERNSAIPKKDYKRLLEYCAGVKGSIGMRDTALIRLCGDLGLRIAEACALNVGDIDLERRELVIRLGKGGKQRTIAINRRSAEALEAWKKRRRMHVAQGEPAFLINVGKFCMKEARGRRMTPKSAARLLNRLYLAVGMPEKISGAHTLRHTAGTQLFQATGGNIAKVARQLGHSNVNTSSIYAHFSLDDMHDAMDLLDED